MNQLISRSWIDRLIILLIMAAIMKSLMLILSFFLPKEGVERVPYNENSFYTKYKPSLVFDLNKNKKVKPKAKPKTVYKLDRLLLKAIYSDTEDPFIAVEENKVVTLISKNETFKGYKLIRIHPHKAIFSKNSREYELTFKDKKNSNIKYSKAEPVPKIENFIEEDRAVFIKRNDIKHYAKNYDQIWKNIKIKEIIKNKRLQGFKVNWIKSGSIFAKMGLLKGDIITGVNGKKFKSISQVFKLYKNLDKLDSLVLKIKRNNQERELEYEIYQ